MRKGIVDATDIRNFLITLFLFIFFLMLFAVSYSFISGDSLDTSIRDALARMFGTNKGEPLIIFAFLFLSAVLIWFVIDYLMKILLNLELGGVKRMVKISGIKDHYIICGYGRVGSHVADRLEDLGEKMVVIERNEEKSKECKNPCMPGDALEEDLLKKVGIQKAKGLFCCFGNPADNIFLTITAKHLNPHIKVGARADNERVASKLRHAGADIIVLPEAVGGFELADEMTKK